MKAVTTLVLILLFGGIALGQNIEHHAKVEIRKVDELNLRSDSMEAECFAWLAVRSLKNLPLSYPTTTGCTRPMSGGILASK